MDSNNNDTEVPEDLFEEQASQSSVRVDAARSKAKAKTHKRRETVECTEHSFRWMKESGLMLNQQNSSFSAYEILKKVINFLRHSQTVQREDDGAVQFWRMKNYLQNQFPQIIYWSDDRWKACLSAGGGAKRRHQSCTDIFRNNYLFPSSSRTFRTQTFDRSLQDNLIIQSGFFQQICHVGCAFNLHSIINSGLIFGQNSSKRQTVFFLPIGPREKGTKILTRLTSLYHVKHNTCTVLGRDIKTRFFGSTSILRFGKDWHSIRLDRMQSSFKEHFQLIVFQKLWDWRLERSYMRNHTCLLDHHQRFHYVTIGQGNWVQKLSNNQKEKLFDNQKEKLFDSLEEKFNTKRSPNQPNQNPNQSVID